MKVRALKTHPIRLGESIESVLDQYLASLQEETIIAITSKVLSICQGRVVSKTDVSKYELITKEADAYLKEDLAIDGAHLTLKNNILIPSAGIDESNGQNMYILYPTDIQDTAIKLWQFLRKRHQLNHLGILITDSHTTPLRKGVTGIALGWCGFKPLYSYVGKPDIFGQPLCVTQVNILDALAASAVFVMGEGDEQTPIALLQDVPKIEFLNRPPTLQEEGSIRIPLEEDVYAPLLRKGEWIWNERT